MRIIASHPGGLFVAGALALLLIGPFPSHDAHAATPGLPITEEFSGSVTPGDTNEAGEPCFVGTPVVIDTANRVEEGLVHLSWTEIQGAEGYEVLRCDASSGPCSLLSLATPDAPPFTDTDATSSRIFWYRVIARTEQAGDLCDSNEYCFLPTGQGASLPSH